MTSHRLDGPALYEALDERRRRLGVTWGAVAKRVGCKDRDVFGRLRAGEGIRADALVSLLVWLGWEGNISELVRPPSDPP